MCQNHIVVLAVISVLFVYGCIASDYIVPDTPERRQAYDNCTERAACNTTNNNFAQGVCYLFCFFDENGDGVGTEQETVDTWGHVVGQGKDVSHSVCKEKVTQACHNMIPRYLIGKMCGVAEHLTKHSKGVMTMGDIRDFFRRESLNGTVPLNFDNYLTALESMRAKAEGVNFNEK